MQVVTGSDSFKFESLEAVTNFLKNLYVHDAVMHPSHMKAYGGSNYEFVGFTAHELGDWILDHNGDEVFVWSR